MFNLHLSCPKHEADLNESRSVLSGQLDVAGGGHGEVHGGLALEEKRDVNMSIR